MSYFLQTTCNKFPTFPTVQHTEKEKETKFQLYHITTHDIILQRIETNILLQNFPRASDLRSSPNERNKLKNSLNLYWKYIDHCFSFCLETEVFRLHILLISSGFGRVNCECLFWPVEKLNVQRLLSVKCGKRKATGQFDNVTHKMNLHCDANSTF